MCASTEVIADVLGRPRPKSGPCSLGCYEGAWDGKSPPSPRPGVAVAVEAGRAFIEVLLKNEYELEWHGMLWGWRKLLPEELPLQIEVQDPGKADFLDL